MNTTCINVDLKLYISIYLQIKSVSFILIRTLCFFHKFHFYSLWSCFWFLLVWLYPKLYIIHQYYSFFNACTIYLIPLSLCWCFILILFIGQTCSWMVVYIIMQYDLIDFDLFIHLIICIIKHLWSSSFYFASFYFPSYCPFPNIRVNMRWILK